MNFLIAVVGNSFSDCMAKREAQTLKVKVDMIYEHEQIMDTKELEDPEKFPQYILVRRPVEAQNEETTHLEHMAIMLRDTQFLVEKIPRMEEVLLQLQKIIKKQTISIDKSAENTEQSIFKTNNKIVSAVSSSTDYLKDVVLKRTDVAFKLEKKDVDKVIDTS